MIGFLIRWGMAFALLAFTYNPTNWNYIRWTQNNYDNEAAIAVLVGLLLVAGYIIYLRATLRSIGLIGMTLVGAIVAALVWVLIDQEVITLDSTEFKIWMTLIGLSFVLGIGLSWSHVRHALSGQYDMDDVDE